MVKAYSDHDIMELDTLFSDLSAAFGSPKPPQDFADRLTQFFKELPFIPAAQPEPELPPPSPSRLREFFSGIKAPLEAARNRGGFMNLWQIAGLKDNEVRTAAALAGLWQADFGGEASRRFAVHYLQRAIENLDWDDELMEGYRVQTEVNPLGETSDRVDLVIETKRYLIGIEVKINAGFGKDQLERYDVALKARAQYTRKIPRLVLLAPFRVDVSQFNFGENIFSQTSWNDVSIAARQAAKIETDSKTFVHHLIAQFGDYIAQH